VTSRIRLLGLTLRGRSVPDATITLSAGLNVIVGASNTGKSYVAQCIDFMLGRSEPPKAIPQADRYEEAELRLLLEEEECWLTRSIRGGDFLLKRPNQAPEEVAAKHQAGSKKTASSLLLGA